jgi:hypothetical protein
MPEAKKRAAARAARRTLARRRVAPVKAAAKEEAARNWCGACCGKTSNLPKRTDKHGTGEVVLRETRLPATCSSLPLPALGAD